MILMAWDIKCLHIKMMTEYFSADVGGFLELPLFGYFKRNRVAFSDFIGFCTLYRNNVPACQVFCPESTLADFDDQ
ncbi:hypothetical protein SDC9_191130 [bioreactor metagenome]|uniref:Uncharacterized protein n=1 Tax=bioreactor metagenome TaxID=1076179 RepID=A0A645HXG1_9ZZZZ